jgi:hypothetical protein
MKLKSIISLISAFIILFTAQSCHRKSHPEKTPEVTKPVVKKKKAEIKPTVAVPKRIMVEDKNAKRTVDGRFYYDFQGKRYWKNKKDGMYYIYNKSMYTDPDFQKP